MAGNALSRLSDVTVVAEGGVDDLLSRRPSMTTP
jgi:hypothetical protein